MSHELTACLSIFDLFKLNELWPYYQKHVNQIILNCKTLESLVLRIFKVQGLRSNFVDCESLLESNSPDILALCETNLDDSIDSGNFSVRGYLPLIRKDSSTHIAWSRSLCEGRSSFCTGLISRKLGRFLLMFSTCFTSLSVLLLFPLLITFFLVMHSF